MRWQDKGFLLSINKYNENSAIAEFFTENNGKISGIIFGSTSKKIKSYLLIGNKFHINFNLKQDTKLGYFKVEIDEAKTPTYLENKNKLLCLIYTMNIVKVLTVDNQENKNIYLLLDNFFRILENDDWLKNYIFWELNFYRCIGYDINFKNYVQKKIINGENKYIVISSNKVIPDFLINNEISEIKKNDIINGFKIVGEFLEKSILRPNNISFPLTRIEFLNLIKQI